MRLSIEEAKNETCPFITEPTTEIDSINQRPTTVYRHIKCRANECKLGWRWTRDLIGQKTRLGYCGFSVKPDSL